MDLHQGESFGRGAQQPPSATGIESGQECEPGAGAVGLRRRRADAAQTARPRTCASAWPAGPLSAGCDAPQAAAHGRLPRERFGGGQRRRRVRRQLFVRVARPSAAPARARRELVPARAGGLTPATAGKMAAAGPGRRRRGGWLRGRGGPPVRPTARRRSCAGCRRGRRGPRRRCRSLRACELRDRTRQQAADEALTESAARERRVVASGPEARGDGGQRHGGDDQQPAARSRRARTARGRRVRRSGAFRQLGGRRVRLRGSVT